MFHDRARIHVQAGRGGDGALSFRREKHVPKGGPDGGDGGPGGDVVLVADPDLRDLSSFRARQWFKAGKGGGGGGSGKHGASGEQVELRVPVGTQVLDDEEQLVADLATAGARGRAGERRPGRPRQQALRHADAPGAALRRDGHARRRGRLRAAAEAARGRGARRAAERGQVVAARPDLEREAEGRRVPVHDPAAGARNGRLGRAAAGGRGRPRPDRRRERGRRARPRVPRAPRAGAAARAPDRRRGRRSGRGLRRDQPRARGVRRRPGRAAAGGRPEQARPASRAAGLRAGRPAGASASSRSRPRRARASTRSAARCSSSARRPRRPQLDEGGLPRFLVYRPKPDQRRRFRILRTERGFRVHGTPGSEEELERALREVGAKVGDEVEVEGEVLEFQ